jgi:guanylate kinase
MDFIQNKKILVFDIDVKGARKLKKSIPNITSIFILPPDEETWKKRLTDRGTESEESLKIRLANGKQELKYASEFDYQITNIFIEQAYKELVSIIKTNGEF